MTPVSTFSPWGHVRDVWVGSNPLLSQYIIGDPGADSGCMYAINAFRPYSSPNKSWETQGQIVGMRKSLNGRGKKMARRLSLAPTICPWVSEDGPNIHNAKCSNPSHDTF